MMMMAVEHSNDNTKHNSIINKWHKLHEVQLMIRSQLTKQ